MRGVLWRLGIAAVLTGAAALAGQKALGDLLPAPGRAARGVRIAHKALGADTTPHELAMAEASARLDRRVQFVLDGKPVFEATGRELGAEANVAEVETAALAVGRERTLVRRIDSALRARDGKVDVPLRLRVPVEPLAERLERTKEEADSHPRGARYDFTTRKAGGEAPGRTIDVFGTAEALYAALAGGGTEVAVRVLEEQPRASAEFVEAIDRTQVLARYQTVFGYTGGQENRAENVRRAASGMDGVVLMPGEVVSFNANVGPRSVENGFKTAPEIYKGEMREGVGGGTCQVAGTLHAAAMMAGVDIVERANHSRPSGYIRMGLDATVVYPVVDLKLRNPYNFPIVLHAMVDKGTLTFELLGRDHPATVHFETATVGVAEYKRKIEEVSWMPQGSFKLKQRGIRGYSIKKVRTIHLSDGRDRVEVSTDTYPPTFEIYQVHPGADPGQVLPPDARAKEDAAKGAG